MHRPAHNGICGSDNSCAHLWACKVPTDMREGLWCLAGDMCSQCPFDTISCAWTPQAVPTPGRVLRQKS